MVERRELANRLASAREQAGFNQAGIAKELGVPRSAVSKMETGDQRIDSLMLAEMARLYGISVSVLLEEDVEGAPRHTRVPAEALLRSAGDLSEEDRRALEEFLEMCRGYAELRRVVGEDYGR